MAAVVLGAGAAVGTVLVTSSPRHRATESTETVGADLVAHWGRWRRATASFTETTTRRNGNRELVSVVEIAQRFPDRIVHDGDDVSARIGGRLIGCTVGRAADAVCTDDAGYRPDRELEIELDAVRNAVTGSNRSYRVSRLDRGCFRLRHVGSDLAPRWGDRLDICFDPGSGIANREVTTTGNLTLTVRRSAIRRVVPDEALRLPATPIPAPTG